MIIINQLEVWAAIAQSAINFIVISVISGNNQKQTVTDNKTDLRHTKEDIMTELKESRSVILKEIDIATQSAIDLIVAEVKNKGQQS